MMKMMWFSILLIVLLLSISSLSLYIGHSHRSSSILTLASKRAITTKTTTTSTTTSAPNHITTKKHTDSSIDTNKKDSPINAEVTIEVNDDFRSVVKGYQREKSPKKMIKLLQAYNTSGALTQNMTAYAFRALQRMNRTDLCPSVLPYWSSCISSHNTNDSSHIEISPGMVLIKGYNRLQRFDLSEEIVSKFQVKLSPLSPSSSVLASDSILLASSKILPEMALSYAYIGKFEKCLLALHAMKELGISIDVDTSKSILKLILRESNSWFIREAIRSLLELKGLNDNDSIQLLTSSFMKNLDFITGAVSIHTLPKEDVSCPEVCFIGRSNVGKSSLINMIANRKGLAFTSKTAGKTTEFNYFRAEGVTGGTMEKTKFHLVDLPGVGYAEASYDRREGWFNLLKEFVKTRNTLKVVFHLVDARHGLLQADEECLNILKELPERVAYVIVLTKVDKLGGEVNRDFINKIDKEIKSRRNGLYTSILLTSSDSRVGGVDIWSVMLDAFNYPDTAATTIPKLYSSIQRYK